MEQDPVEQGAAGLDRRGFLRVAGLSGVTVAAAAAGALPAGAAPAVRTGAGGAPTLAAVSDGLGGSWLTGDTHVHTDHSSDGSLPRQGLQQQGPGTTSVGTQVRAAERRGLSFLPITDHRTYDQHWDPQWTSSQVLLIPGEEANSSPHATVIGSVDQIVDGANPPGSAAYRHVQQSIWEVHAQGASWGTAHPDDGELVDDFTVVRVNDNASAVGVDTVEIFNTENPERKIGYAEDRWNAGFRFGIAAASDSHFSETDAVAGPGLPLTRVLATARTERAILDALRAGRTTVARDAVRTELTLIADLDGDGVADAVGGDERLVAAGRTVTLTVRAQRGVGTTVFLYRSPGRGVAPLLAFQPVLLDETRTVSVTVPAGQSWFRVEARGPGGVTVPFRDPAAPQSDPANLLQAATSPLFLSTSGPAVARPETPLPPDSGSDAAVPVVGEAGRFAGFADLAVTADATLVVAEAHSPGRTSVLARRLPADGGAPSPAVDLAPASGAARFPRVAARGDDVWVVWQDERSGQLPRRPDVFARHSTDGGRSWLPEQHLTRGAGRAERPVVALTAQGLPLVAWMDNRGGPFDVLAQVLGHDAAPANLSAPGKVVDAGNAADSRSARYPASLMPAVAVAADGRLVVVWEDDRNDPDPLFTGRAISLDGPASGGTAPDDFDVLAATRAPGAPTWTAPVNVSTSPTRCDRHADVAVDATGRLHVVWDSKELRAAGANLSLRTASSSDGGATFTAAQPLALAPDAMSQRPRLGWDPDATLRVVWYDSRASDWRWTVMTATHGEQGWSPEQALTGPGNGTWPALAGGRVAFTSDRGATGQRDRSHAVLLLDAVQAAGAPPSSVPEAPVAALLAVAGGVVLAGAAARHGARGADPAARTPELGCTAELRG